MAGEIYNNFTLDAEGNILSVGDKAYLTGLSFAKSEYFDLTGSVRTLSVQSNGEDDLYVVDLGTFTNYRDFTNDGTDGKITYGEGIEPLKLIKPIFISATISLEGNATTEYVFTIAVNGITVASVFQTTSATANVLSSASISTIVLMEDNDYIEVYLGNMKEVANLTVKSLIITAHG